MDYKAAIAKVAADLPEIAEIIMAHVGNLNSESASRRHELSEVIKLVEALKKTVGDDVDLVSFVSEAKKKADTESIVTSDLQAKLDTAIALAATEQRRYTLLKASQLSGADEEALNKLLETVSTDKISIDSEVKIEGKPLKEYATNQAKFWESALFPASTPAMPTGGVQAAEPTNPTANYLQQQAARLFDNIKKP